MDMVKKPRREIRLPDYSAGEELFNAISHGVGALLSAAALVLMLVRARGALEETTAALFGAAMIVLYTMSCLYHGLSPERSGKKVLRVLDHCNVYLLVLGTYIPVSLLGVGGGKGWALFGAVCFFTVLGIVFTAIDVDRFQVVSVICHLCSGWSILIGVPDLLRTMGADGLLQLILGGVAYTVGSVLYGLGKRKKYRHCVFHVFCILGTFFHFWAVYAYLL
ncbi:MAG: hemolysin III family protein [Oscillospiraceae bacterium]|nr:hemolysin III family protein [Oscillospiraceae bacterium]